KDTILVHVGDQVVAGQTLGLAGSSGSSTLGHLHFQVEHNGAVVEPDYDPGTFWVDPLPYQNQTRTVLDSGVTSSPTFVVSDLLTAEERQASANPFTQAAGQEITFWFQDYTAANDNAAIRVYKPDGTEYAPLEQSFSVGESRGGSYYFFNTLPAGLPTG